MPRSAELEAMRDYVMWQSGAQNQAESTVLLNVTHSNLKAKMFEIRLDRHMTVERVKEKLRTHTGTGSAFMHLTMLDENGQVVADLTDETLMLGYFSPCDGWSLHITDLDPHSLSAGGGLEDVSLVKKYEISEEDYLKRDQNFRKWKEDKKKADPTWSFAREIRERQEAQRKKADPNYVPPPRKEPITDEEHQSEEAAVLQPGMRCEVKLGGKRGEVRFVGKVPQIAPGWWVGVQYDEPVGKNDGSIKGARFFECPPTFGGFVRPDKLEVGDFPERDILDSDVEDE